MIYREPRRYPRSEWEREGAYSNGATEARREARDEALDDVARLRGELFALRESLGKGNPY